MEDKFNFEALTRFGRTEIDEIKGDKRLKDKKRKKKVHPLKERD